jgi:UDP-N-acetylglucosamine:LPS N-acetylglucosamine transferase
MADILTGRRLLLQGRVEMQSREVQHLDQAIKPRRILAVASGGGHWVQLLRTMSAFEGHSLAFASTIPSLRGEVADYPFYHVSDANRRRPIALLRLVLKMAWIVLKERPQIVVSTGAAPGYMSLLLGKMTGAQTIWIDSIANVDRLSMSGKLAGKLADLWLTQWPQLAKPGGPHFAGAVI